MGRVRGLLVYYLLCAADRIVRVALQVTAHSTWPRRMFFADVTTGIMSNLDCSNRSKYNACSIMPSKHNTSVQ